MGQTHAFSRASARCQPCAHACHQVLQMLLFFLLQLYCRLRCRFPACRTSGRILQVTSLPVDAAESLNFRKTRKVASPGIYVQFEKVQFFRLPADLFRSSTAQASSEELRPLQDVLQGEDIDRPAFCRPHACRSPCLQPTKSFCSTSARGTPGCICSARCS